VLLYGESGAGKSSLINAGLIPAAEQEGFRADRIRVQPRPAEELVVERLRATAEGESYLPSSFAQDGDGDARVVLSTEAFRDRLRALPATQRPLLIFDQFEELSTLFDTAAQDDVLEAQRRIVALLADLLRDERAPLKLLLVFREDYLAKINKLLASRPELVDQSVRLIPPTTDALPEIIRGPFEKYPGHFAPELSPELAARVREAIEARSASGVNLSEVQVACLRLWESPEPERLFAEKGVQGLLEDYLSESLDRFPNELRGPAIAVLSHMVTASGTRNVVSAEDLVADVGGEEDIPPERVERALAALEQETKLVRRERRRDVDLYEIVSEFLLPWIRRKREERLAALAAAAEARRQTRVRKRLVAALVALLVLVGAFAAIAVWALAESHRAQRERASALASRAIRETALDPLAGLVLAMHAIDARNDTETQSALRTALAADDVRTVLRGHTDQVERASFSPDGKLVVTASDDGTARIWDAATGRQVQVLHVGDPVISARFTPDGRGVLTGSTDGTLRYWTSAGRPVWRKQFGPLVFGPEISPDGRSVLVGLPDGTVRVWDTSSRSFQGAPPKAFPGMLTAAAISPNGRGLLLAGEDGSVRILDTRTGRFVRVVHLSGPPIGAAAFSPDGKEIVLADGDVATVLSVDKGGAKLATLTGHTSDITSVQYSPDGRYIVTAGDTTARVWDAATGNSIAVLRGHGDSVLDASFSRDDRVATASADTTARVWDLQPIGSPIVLAGHRDRVYDADFSPDGKRVVTASRDTTARVWDARTGATRETLRTPGAVFAATYLPNGSGIVLAGYAGAWVTPQPHHPNDETEPLSNAGASGVDVGADDTFLIVGLDGKAVIEHLRGRRLLPAKGVVSAVFGAGGSKIVTAGDGGVEVWDARTLKRLLRLNYPAKVLFASFSPDGKRIATASSDTTARIWDASTGRQIRVLRGHTATVTSARFSPDGTRLVTSSKDKTVRVWNADTGALQAIFTDHTDVVWNAAFSPDGKRIVTASSDGTARIYPLTPVDELLELARQRLSASVTSEEEQAIVAQP
jgi:WD40 repeat protein